MQHHVDVTGVGSAAAPPDLVCLDLRVSCDGADVAGTLEDANHRMASVQAECRRAGIAGADLQTTGAGVHPRWTNDGRQDGYTAFSTLRVRVRDQQVVGGLIRSASAVAGDAFGIEAISLSIDDPEPLLAVARERAFADARSKAEQYAALAGCTLGEVIRVSDLPVDGGPGPRTEMVKARSAGGAADLSVAAGESSVSAGVWVRWAWATS